MFTSYLTRLFTTAKVTCYLTTKTVNSKNDLYKMCGISKNNINCYHGTLYTYYFLLHC